MTSCLRAPSCRGTCRTSSNAHAGASLAQLVAARRGTSAQRSALMSSSTDAPRPTAVLVGVQLPGVTDAEQRSSLKELGRLCKTLGFTVVGEITQKRTSLGAATLL